VTSTVCRRFTPIATRAIVAPRFAANQRLSRYYTSGSTISQDPTDIEEEKQKNLRGKQHHTSTPHKEHAPGWNEYLATSSEAAVKADQAGGVSPQELQKETVIHIKKRHSIKTDSQWNPFTEIESEATYEKDEVEGPLGKTTERNEMIKKKMKNAPQTGSEESVKADRGEH